MTLASRPNLPFLYSLTIILIISFYPTPSFSQTKKKLTGQEIFDRSRERYNMDDEKELISMTLDNGKGAQEIRKLVKYSQKGDHDLYKYALFFLKPSAIRGVSFLTWQRKDGRDDQWLYLPSIGKRLKRIAKGSIKSSFMGTDYTYEDIMSSPKKNYIYQRLDDHKNHYVLKIIPKNSRLKKESGYKYRIMSILKDNFFPDRIEYFNKKGVLFKVQTFHNISKVSDIGAGKWRAGLAVMLNLETKHSTKMENIGRWFSKGRIKDHYFSKNFILSERHLRLK